MISFRFIIVCFAILSNLGQPSFTAASNSTNGMKPYRLRVLSMMCFTGYAPRDNQLCKAAVNMVGDLVNNRSDILPNYQIEWDFQDEAAAGAKAVPVGIEYLRRMENAPADIYPSPVAVGPFLGTGCKYWGATASYVNMVMMAGSCTTPSQTANRRIYPNMYRPRGPAETHIFSRVYYLKKETKLRKLAILFHVENSYNYETANLFYKISSTNGFEVQAFEQISINLADEVMISLKKRDVRVFAIESAEGIVGLKFLCQAYKFGITGPRYVFILQLVGYVNIFSMPYQIFDDCNRDVILEQYKSTMVIGSSIEALMPTTGRTTLGQTAREFEEMFDRYTNRSRTADYDFRHLCYDRALEAVIMLNDAEQALAKRNMSLRDYRQFPREVMLITNETAGKVQYESLRFGHFHYSARLEFDYEPILVTVFSKEKQGLLVTHTVSCQVNKPANDVNSYSLVPIEPGRALKLPNDSPTYWNQFDDVTVPTFGVVVGLSATLALGQFVVGASVISRWRTEEMAWTKSLLLVGCILMDAASISFATTNDMKSLSSCLLQVIFLVSAIGLVHGVILSYLTMAHHKLIGHSFSRFRGTSPGVTHNNNGSLSIRRSTQRTHIQMARKCSNAGQPDSVAQYQPRLTMPNAANVPCHSNQLKDDGESEMPRKAAVSPVTPTPTCERSHSLIPTTGKTSTVSSIIIAVGEKLTDRYVLAPSLGFFVLNVILMISWLSTDPLFPVKRLLSSEPRYDLESDTYESSGSVVCNSLRPDDADTSMSWIAALICLNAAALLFAAARALKLRKISSSPNNQHPESANVKRFVFAVILAISLYLCTIAIVLISSSNIMKMLTIAFASIVYSASISIIVFYDVLKSGAVLLHIVHENRHNNL